LRVFKPKYKGRDGKVNVIKKWYVELKDHQCRLRRIPGFRDKKATMEFGRKIEKVVSMCVAGEPLTGELGKWVETLPATVRERFAKIGILDSEQAASSRTLTEHLASYEKALTARMNSPRYVVQVIAKVKKICKGCRFKYWSDINSGKVYQYLDSLRNNGRGVSSETFNQYLRAIKQFANWMVSEGRASASPVAHLKALNVRTDRRHDRRALTSDELKTLLDAASSRGAHHGLTGEERRLLYILAVETGFRWSEIRSLKKSNFSLEIDPPTVRVDATYSKHKMEDVLPLRPSTAAELARYLAMKLPSSPAFPMWKQCGSNMLREDLEAAGIDYRDEQGRYADFHALRHTFLTNLAMSGVHPKIAQSLARHSDINLTMNRYTHILLETQSDALKALPNLGSSEPSSNPSVSKMMNN